jgi:hypothetical protein
LTHWTISPHGQAVNVGLLKHLMSPNPLKQFVSFATVIASRHKTHAGAAAVNLLKDGKTGYLGFAVGC